MSVARGVRVVAALAVGGAVAVAVAVGGCAAWVSAASAGRVYSPTEVAPRDVAIILAAQVYADGTPAPFTAARLDLGLQLFKQGKARVLVVSGNNSAAHNHETTNMRRYLEQRGVPASRIVEDTAGNDTYDTCIRARDTFGVTSAILVSQSYHLPRAIAACQGLGVDAVGVGDSTVSDRDFWPIGVAREFPANVKLAIDLLRRNPPEVVEPPTDAVAAALRGA